MAGAKVQSFDRRAHSRIPGFLSCEIRAGELTVQGTLLNASLGGLFISSTQELPEGSNLAVTLEIPESGKTISLSGSVIRVSRGTSKEGATYKLGVRLSHITPESMALVRALASEKTT